MQRRKVLVLLMKVSSLAAAGIVALPSLISAFAPIWRTRPREQWQPVGSLATFPPGEVTHTLVQVARDDWAETLRMHGVYVWRPSEEEIIVFSRSCTDLGCPVVWDEGSRWFLCPCHGGIFDTGGERRAGPPRRPLRRYASRVHDGHLEIDVRSLPPMV